MSAMKSYLQEATELVATVKDGNEDVLVQQYADKMHVHPDVARYFVKSALSQKAQANGYVEDQTFPED